MSQPPPSQSNLFVDTDVPPRQLVEVVLPLPLQNTFTYAIPSTIAAQTLSVGCRVVVPFGKKKFYTAIVVNFPRHLPTDIEVKNVALILDQTPVIRRPQLQLWEWMAQYYLCAVGDVYKAAIPSGLKIESETFVELNPDFDLTAEMPSDPAQIQVVAILQHENKALTVAQISQKLDLRGISRIISALIEKGVLIISEKLVERYRAKKLTYITPADPSQQGISQAFETLKGAPKQETLMLALMQMLRTCPSSDGVERGALLKKAGLAPNILLAMVRRGVLRSATRQVSRFQRTSHDLSPLPTLTKPQQEALEAIHQSFKLKDVTLLHGVTSSGKTEIYIHLIDFVLHRGDQVLYLVPEIALTTQLTQRLQSVFGDKVVIYHSKFSDNERVDIWQHLLHSTEPCVVIAPRSGVFLPLAHVGLVIVDEEHDASYKQAEPAPRYSGRDAAMMLARMHGAKVLLGSATPSVETYYKAQTGKYGLVSLKVRYGDVKLPAIKIVDITTERKAKTMSGAFALATIRLAREALQRGAQVIFFQNRRGYAPLIRCQKCSWVPSCRQCDVSLTYHQFLHQLQCHYCGAVYPLPKVCPQCGEPTIDLLGFGTERVTDDVASIFKDVPTLRMDLDSTRSKDSYTRIIDDFSQRKAQILVGTQMVTKGLDFQGVEMVGVLSADNVLHYPDFRSTERAFNMLEQVSGRAGRSDDTHSVVAIQTYEPSHPVLRYVVAHDYNSFYNHEIAERQRYFYPPYCRLIYIYLKHKDVKVLRELAQNYADELRRLLGQRVFGPEEPSINRIQGLYIRKIMLKLEINASPSKLKDLLRDTYIRLHADPRMRSLVLYYDVDPQ